MNIERLMRVANRAKTIGNKDYRLPNVIFAILLQRYLGETDPTHGLRSLIDQGSVNHLAVQLETKDADGFSPEEVYYDLLCILARNEEKTVIDSICIPVPLLDPYSVIATIKNAEIVERNEHVREFEEPQAFEHSDLWEELLKALPAEIILGCTEKHLCREAFVKAKRVIENLT